MDFGATSAVHVELVWKIRLAKASLQFLRSTLTLVSSFSFKGFDPKKHSVVIPEAFVSPWKTDKEFSETYAKLRRYTTVDLYRCYELWHLLGQVMPLGGDVLEVGVWRGGTGCLLAARAQVLSNASKVYLCDTFSGVVKAGKLDNFYKGGEHADTSMELVGGLARSMGLSNVEISSGDISGRNRPKHC